MHIKETRKERNRNKFISCSEQMNHVNQKERRRIIKEEEKTIHNDRKRKKNKRKKTKNKMNSAREESEKESKRREYQSATARKYEKNAQ